MMSWKQLQYNNTHGTSVVDQLGSARSQQILKNRHYLKTIAEIVLFCSHQEIALRGHKEGEQSANRGNFLQLLELIGQYDSEIKKKILHGPQNAKYTSAKYPITGYG